MNFSSHASFPPIDRDGFSDFFTGQIKQSDDDQHAEQNHGKLIPTPADSAEFEMQSIPPLHVTNDAGGAHVVFEHPQAVAPDHRAKIWPKPVLEGLERAGPQGTEG